jgi:hypothetical protein
VTNIRYKKYFISALVVLLASSLLAVGYLSVRLIKHDDPAYLVAAQKISKSLIMRALDGVEIVIAGPGYAPTPLDSTGFRYANLAHPYFDQVRQDARLSKFYAGISTVDLEEVLLLKNYLRDLFPHGDASRDYINSNVIEMIDAAENGESFLCGDAAKMLAQLIQAGGTQARTVILESPSSGHVVVEFWSKQYNKWILVDPDYNVFYTDASGMPLSAYEVYLGALNNRGGDIRRIVGKSKNNILADDRSLLDEFYKNGIAVHFYNRWVDENLPRVNPGRSPAIASFYIGNSPVEGIYYKHDSVSPSNDLIKTLYINPSEYTTVPD